MFEWFGNRNLTDGQHEAWTQNGGQQSKLLTKSSFERCERKNVWKQILWVEF